MSREIGYERARRILERPSPVDAPCVERNRANIETPNQCYTDPSAERTDPNRRPPAKGRNVEEVLVGEGQAKQPITPAIGSNGELGSNASHQSVGRAALVFSASDENVLTLQRRVIARSWETAISSVNLDSALARRCICSIAGLFAANHSNKAWHCLWEEHCSSYFDLEEADSLLEKYVELGSGMRLFLLQTYCRLLMVEVLDKVGHDVRGVFKPGFFDWLDLAPEQTLEAIRTDIAENLALGDIREYGSIEDVSNFLSYMYQEIFPPELRHLTGEYYTPSWLIDYSLSTLDCLGTQPCRPVRVLDPAAGSGGFLAHYIERASKRGVLSHFHVAGADVNPLAVDFCEANLAVAKRMLGSLADKVTSIVLLADTICDPSDELTGGPLFDSRGRAVKTVLSQQFRKDDNWAAAMLLACQAHDLSDAAALKFTASLRRYLDDTFSVCDSWQADVIVGNPPWMTWDALRGKYREKIAAQWSSSSLVTQKGWRAKVAAGKTDLSTLFVYRAAERHAACTAVMGFVLPLSLFQSRHAGAGFRRFRCASGRQYKLASLDDFSEIRVFGDAANRAAVALFQVDSKPDYPAKFVKWASDKSRGALVGVRQFCRPIDQEDQASPIVAFKDREAFTLSKVGKSDYRARGGVNTGGANTILWADVVEKEGKGNGLVRVQNVGITRKTTNRIHSGWVEREILHPLLVGADVYRWRASPSKHILMLYSADQPKKAMEESVAKAKYPHALEFVSNFRNDLVTRKEYHRWGGVGPFYEVYRIGPYTFSSIKVVWQHTGFRDRLRVAVLDDRGGSVTIPDQKVILIPTTSFEEAHYICAFLSSSFVSSMLKKYLGTDASTHILDYIGLKAYSEQNSHHRRLAQLSAEAHQAVASGGDAADCERNIDSVVETMLVRIS